MPEQVQDLKSHAKYDPPFHFFLVPLGLLFLTGTVYQLVQNASWNNAGRVLFVIWVIVAVFKMRLYSLKVQDRVIRLEERLRVEKLCGAERANQLTIDQLIGLRFASDNELPGLVDKALASRLPRKEIKAAIVTWRPDHWRV
ncbi:MAG TPA: DUF6526 family protein [Bryobacteraceae bacterium]|jgi:hypothetical protein|nr:DUF6526 family protein [Bryobacteraceae bacterium]